MNVAWPWKLLSCSIFKLSSQQYICFVLWPVMIPSWYWNKQICGNSHGGSKPFFIWHHISFTVTVILSIFYRNVCFLKCHGEMVGLSVTTHASQSPGNRSCTMIIVNMMDCDTFFTGCVSLFHVITVRNAWEKTDRHKIWKKYLPPLVSKLQSFYQRYSLAPNIFYFT